ncbi:hypothetical protein [Flavobacterium sp. ASV13]|uniref:hypothetical protein n=1 Tax=Flavobacterium sp. ASV13 TaxID=1506583 RepID=UPI000554249F|nr:hypothetical protein [Flavobacterium sp. ASV13]
MRKIITTKSKESILSIEDTLAFIECLDLALRNTSTEMLKEIFEKFDLIDHFESGDFLSMSRFVFKRYNNHEEKIQVVKVEHRNTYCVACSFGKKVKAYDIEYKKEDSNISIVYNSSFAINLEIFEGELINYSWCNAFLSKEEMKNILEIK